MYKVFINDKPIIFTSSLINEDNFTLYNYNDIVIDEILHKLTESVLDGVYLHCVDVKDSFQNFLQNFKVITAGGGLVINSKKEILSIFRGGKWDLPKGRIEKGEQIEDTAVREVEEECGIKNVVIDCFLLKTYHIFYWNNEPRIKETYWYLMKSDYKGELKPQVEEGITDVVFKSEQEVVDVFENTYANIKLVYNCYKLTTDD